MKVFVATYDGQGGRPSDFSWTVEGELVSIPFECGTERDDIDGRCGCRRAMSGLASAKATTTFKVVEMNITIADYEAAVAESNCRCGWAEDAQVTPEVRREAAELLAYAHEFPVDRVLERRGREIRTRPAGA